MSTNPIRLEWTEQDEIEFQREKHQAQFDDYYNNIEDDDDNELDDLNYIIWQNLE